MKPTSPSRSCGFTLIETVIAIGVLAVLLTGFMMVFAPAAAGIRKSLNVQEADRLASTLELELVTQRTGQLPTVTTGFAKAFDYIQKSNTVAEAILVYQYRGDLKTARSPVDDGTLKPMADITGKRPGQDYVVQSMVRRKSDTKFVEDLPAIEGGVYLVKCTQLVFSGTSGLIPGTLGTIKDQKGTTTYAAPDGTPPYPEAVIAFSADFYALPTKAATYFGASGKLSDYFGASVKKPVFTRNLAVRR